MSTINAYLTFSGNCREAMNFYRECFGGQLNIQAVGETPACDHLPAEAKDSVMHSMLINDQLIIMGSDMAMEKLQHGNTISLSLGCKTEEETREKFQKLSTGGHITHPLKVEFWGALFGTLTDKYGFNWLITHVKM